MANKTNRIPPSQRFEARFRNGAWGVFDRVNYTTVTAHGLQKHAVEQAGRRNAIRRV